MEQALVSVVIPTLRRPRLVLRALNSVLGQTLRQIEVIVVVDGPDEETVAALSAVHDPRLLIVVNSESVTAAGARNAGVLHAKGDWIAFLDDDDEWLSDKLEQQLALARDRGDVLVSCLSLVITPTWAYVLPERVFDNTVTIDDYLFDRRTTFAGSSFIQTSSYFLPRTLYERSPFRTGCADHDDWDFLLRLSKNLGVPIEIVPAPLVKVYSGEQRPSVSGGGTWLASLAWIDSVRPMLTPRAYSGFCLCVVGYRAANERAYPAFFRLLSTAFRNGAPRIQHVVMFLAFWVVPHGARRHLRTFLPRAPALRDRYSVNIPGAGHFAASPPPVLPSAMPLTWALAIATYSRPEALRLCVLCAIEQTRPPCEVIIVDSSPSQQSLRQAVDDLILQSGTNVRLHYIHSPIAQQTIQRNLAIDAASADVLFMIDDDAYMYPACAEKVMAVFEADSGKQIAAVGPAPAANSPVSGGEAPPALGIPLPRRAAERWAYVLFGLWYWPHKERYPHFDLPTTPLPIRRTRIIHGYRMIVRRDIARTCRFDENLAAGLHEDLDASYRFAQQGALADLELPLIYHDRAPRPAEQPRKGSIQRYAYIAGHVYLARQYFGHSLYVRLHAYFSMWRYLPLDLIYAIRRGNAAQLRGTIEGLKAAWRLAMAPADRTGSIYAAGCRAYREQLIRGS